MAPPSRGGVNLHPAGAETDELGAFVPPSNEGKSHSPVVIPSKTAQAPAAVFASQRCQVEPAIRVNSVDGSERTTPPAAGDMLGSSFLNRPTD
jgi:hypothetical protein